MRIGRCALEGRSGHRAGRELLARLYREETGETLPAIRIEKRGKPYFAESEYHFSISHTAHYAFCILAKEPVGIDAEELNRQVSESLVRRVLSPGEYAQYLQAEDRNRAFLTFWVLKEAQVKLTGQGLRGFPNDTDFRLDDPRVRLWDGCLVAVVTHNRQKDGQWTGRKDFG